MEFYAKPKRLSLTPISVSIPNGMEFYLSKLQRAPDFGGFQFPTGWNSTLLLFLLFLFLFRFNSQRDGILPASSKKPAGPDTVVSIPNGMEFYASTPRPPSVPRSFNSQRDGILQMALDYPALLFQVSIPNGMEFYLRSFPPRIDCEQVSIPNGMEFYGTTSTQFLIFKMFQFPTGWNSTMN